MALLKKELFSHQISFFIAFGLMVLHFATLAVRKFHVMQPNSQLRFALEAVPLLWFMLPWLIGSVAVAEERKLGMMECQLCLPTTRRLQFVLKFSVALLLGILLGAIVPAAIEMAGAFAGVQGEIFGHDPESPAAIIKIFLGVSGFAAAIGFLSFFASTFARNTLHALGTAVVVTILFAFIISLAILAAFHSNRFFLCKGPLIFDIGVPVMLGTVLWLSFMQSKLLWVTWKNALRSVVSLAVALLFVLIVTVLLYQRVWELAMPLEPQHGPKQLSGPVRPKLCFAGEKMFALLPDGRLWMETEHTNLFLGEFYDTQKGTNVLVIRPFPTHGVFLSSNWVDIASAKGLIGIQADGSLWKIYEMRRGRAALTNRAKLEEVPAPKRIGSDSNWQQIVAGNWHFLALKKDGTIWGWGDNHDGQLGPGPKQITNDWARVGSDSDWIKIFASENTSYGIKQDGSVWKWGGDLLERRNRLGTGMERVSHVTPRRCGFEGTNWLAIQTVNDACDLALRDNGTLWVAGEILPNLFGSVRKDARWYSAFTQKPVQLTNAPALAMIQNWNDYLLGVTSTGELLQNRAFEPRNAWGQKVWRPSRFSDWLSIDEFRWANSFAGLAADGTVSFWKYGWYPGENLLAPSRKAIWSLNILRATK